MNIKNMLLLNQGLPLFNLFNVHDIEPTISNLLREQHNNFVSLEEKISKEDDVNKIYNLISYENEIIDHPLDFAWSAISHLKSVKNTEELRTAYEKCLPELVKESSYVSQSKYLFDGLKKLKNSNEFDPVKNRIIRSAYDSMFLSGIDLEEDNKKRFNEIKIRLSELSNKFSNNVLDYIKDYRMIIHSDDEFIKSVPRFALELYSQKAKEQFPESTPENGPWKVTLDIPSYLPFMSHYSNSNLRESLYKARVMQASYGDTNNLPIIKEILELKSEIAKLLGYENYVEISLQKKMASNQKEIEDLLNDLAEKSKVRALREIEEIKSFKLEKGDKGELNPWDITYYAEKMKEEKLGLKEEELKPYFPLENVLKGLFGLANNLFGIKIVESIDDVQVWDSEVKFFNVYDESNNEHIASFYLDPYSRPENKRGGAWMNTCIGRSKVMNKKPVAYLICNGSPPVKNDDKNIPSLMTFREVETLFHEFGHGLQHMLTEVEDGPAAGIGNVEWDAVELPSQFMENWCYHKPTFTSFARHYETDEQIPDELFEKILKQKTFMAGNTMCRQLYFSALDMYLHNNLIENENILDVKNKIAEKFLVKQPLDEDRFLNSFNHIFSGGYSAGYYSYKWAEVMSADCFGAFEEIGFENEKEIKELGMKFRKTILAKGGGTHPTNVFKEFRGRELNTDALLRHNGLL